MSRVDEVVYDIVIIGAGPGGYVAAIRGAQLGARVCVIEKDKLGGVCLNKGCIPTKALISNIELIRTLKKAEDYGIKVSGYEIDRVRIASRKDEIVTRLVRGIETLFKARSINLIKGTAKLIGENEVEVAESKEKVKAKDIIIATGSSPLELPFLKFDAKAVFSSDDLLSKNETISGPARKLLIVGGGVIGCEFARIFKELDWDVTIVEMMEQLLPNMDREIAKKLEAALKKEGIRIYTGKKVEEVAREEGEITATLSDGSQVLVEKVLVCVGRRPNSAGIGLEESGIKMEKGRIIVDDTLRTNVPNIYAIGDVIGGYLLAHVASYEGVIAVENAMGKSCKVDYNVVPNCIFTHPEIASVGLTEAQARQANYDVKLGKFPFIASGKAHAMGQTEGFAKIVGDGEGNILGAQIFGPQATELIAEVAAAMKMGARVCDIADTIHAHPTLSEATKEAAENFYGRATHIP